MRLPTQRRILALLVLIGPPATIVLGPAGPAHAASYSFEVVADSADGFDPFAFGCAAINDTGQVAFRGGRVTADFTQIPGVYRVDADGRIRVIAENRARFDFIGFNPSLNDQGVVSFAATVGDGGPGFEAILVGAGANRLLVIADTRGQFASFGFDTSINNRREVAFKAELDDSDEGLFSRRPTGSLTTHYLAASSVFDGTDSRPAINTGGDVAFEETVGGQPGVFIGQEGLFQPIVARAANVSAPTLNDGGQSAFYRVVNDGDRSIVEVLRAQAGGPRTLVADTRTTFTDFGFRPPALSENGDVAFLAIQSDFVTAGIFVGPDPLADRVITVDDVIAGQDVNSLRFCEEGLNAAGQLTFVADLQDPQTLDAHTAVIRATPSS